MKFISSFVSSIGVAMLLATFAHAQGFQGVLTMQVTVPQLGMDKTEMTVSIKNGKTVTDVNSAMGETKIYTDLATQKRTMVIGKMGMEMDMKEASKMAPKDSNRIVPKPTGEKKVINGYSAEMYKATMKDGGELDFWVTGDLPKDLTKSIGESFGGTLNGMSRGKGGGDPMEDFISKGLSPIEIVASKDGKQQMELEFVKYEKKPLDDAVFLIPSDITIQRMPMMGGPGGPGGQH